MAATAATEGLVPITRKYLASYYDKYPFTPLSDDVSRLSSEIRAAASDLLHEFPASEDESVLVQEADAEPAHKIDENMWKNREQLEEILFLLEKSRCPAALQQASTSEDSELATVFDNLRDKFRNCLSSLMSFQAKNSEHVFNTVMTYLPQDFRGTIIRQQRERSERNKQAEVDALVDSGGSIRDRYALLWKQQMDRRRQLAQLGSATGVYKTLVKYLVGVPQVLLDFIRQINDDDGPMEEQRHRYGPPLYSLTTMVLCIRLLLLILWGRFEASKLKRDQVALLEQAADVYSSEFVRFITFLSEVFSNAPFFISAEVAGALEGKKNDDYSEISVPAGKTYEVSLSVESVNSYIAWDFSLVQGKINMVLLFNDFWVQAFEHSFFSSSLYFLFLFLFANLFFSFLLVILDLLDIGFSLEYTDASGNKSLILPYGRYESDQGNFCTVMAGNYKLVWDNSYSTFFKKVLRYKVDCVPPVMEPVQSADEVKE